MDLTMNSQTVTLLHPTVNQVMDFITNFMEKDVYYSHMIADGAEIYEDGVAYLKVHLSDIQRLEVKTKTLADFVHDNLLSAKEYLERAIPLVIHLTDRFYQNPSDDDWHEFNELLNGIEWLEQMVTAMDRAEPHLENREDFSTIFSSLQEELKGLEEALKNKDNVLIADLILYEILPLLKELSSEIEKTIETEEQRHDLD